MGHCEKISKEKWKEMKAFPFTEGNMIIALAMKDGEVESRDSEISTGYLTLSKVNCRRIRAHDDQ